MGLVLIFFSKAMHRTELHASQGKLHKVMAESAEASSHSRNSSANNTVTFALRTLCALHLPIAHPLVFLCICLQVSVVIPERVSMHGLASRIVSSGQHATHVKMRWRGLQKKTLRKARCKKRALECACGRCDNNQCAVQRAKQTRSQFCWKVVLLILAVAV